MLTKWIVCKTRTGDFTPMCLPTTYIKLLLLQEVWRFCREEVNIKPSYEKYSPWNDIKTKQNKSKNK